MRARIAELRRRRALWARMREAQRVPAAAAFAAFGSDTLVVEPSRVQGARFIAIGDRVLVHELAWLIARRAPDGTDPRLTIGDDCRLGRFVKVVCTGEVTFGPGCLTSDHVYVSDTAYRHQPGAGPIARQGLAPPRPVRIGERVFLGVGAKVLPGVTIGDDAHVGAGAVVTADVAAGAVVVGNPARELPQAAPRPGAT